MRILTVICAIALAAMLFSAAVAQQQQPDPMQRAVDAFRDMPESKSLRWNASTMQNLARLDGDNVLPLLLGAYRNPPGDNPVNMQHLAVQYIRERYDNPPLPGQKRRALSAADTRALKASLAREVRRESGVWAVYCFSYILALQDNPELDLELLETVGNARVPAINRAVTLQALVKAGCSFARRALEILLQQEFKANAQDGVIFEAAIWSIADAYRDLHKPDQPVPAEWRTIFERVLELYDNEEALLSRSRKQVPLALQSAFGTVQPYPYAISWRNILVTGKDPAAAGGHSVSRFMGLEIVGERVVFVIDLSDSMLVPMDPALLEDLQRPVTGDRDRDRNRRHYEINWRAVRNRFDAAKEQVKWTVSRLPEDTQFAVVLFGSGVEMLPATPQFIAASDRNVRMLISALDSLRPKPAPRGKEDIRPDGILMGETNYYQALVAAFRVSTRGLMRDPYEHFDPRLFTNGADEIFFLSDGTPNRDGFSGANRSLTSRVAHESEQPGPGEWVEIPARPAQPARPAGVSRIRDPETGIIREVPYPAQPAQPAQPARRLWYQFVYGFDDNGPYAPPMRMSQGSAVMFRNFEVANLLAEIERMNLVRRARVHCIGIGEARMDWLEPIAEVGGGQATFFGREQGAAPGNANGGIPGRPNQSPGGPGNPPRQAPRD